MYDQHPSKFVKNVIYIVAQIDGYWGGGGCFDQYLFEVGTLVEAFKSPGFFMYLK